MPKDMDYFNVIYQCTGMAVLWSFSALEIVFCVFMAENNFVKVLIQAFKIPIYSG